MEDLTLNLNKLSIIPNLFNIEEYLEKIRIKILYILNRKQNDIVPYDILDTDVDIEHLLIELRNKQRRMKYGEIWQMVIGEYYKFEDLKKGHITGLDILSSERKIIIELKNRYNTDNSSSLKTNLDKLSKFKLSNKDYTCIYGVINEKNNIGIKKTIFHKDIEIMYLSGNYLFDFIFQEHKDIILNNVKDYIKK